MFKSIIYLSALLTTIAISTAAQAQTSASSASSGFSQTVDGISTQGGSVVTSTSSPTGTVTITTIVPTTTTSVSAPAAAALTSTPPAPPVVTMPLAPLPNSFPTDIKLSPIVLPNGMTVTGLEFKFN